MRIESKATGLPHFLTKDQWDKMESHKKRLYNIIDSSDLLIPKINVEEVKITPRDVFEVDLREDEIQTILDDCTRADIKELLDEQGLEYGDKDLHRELAIKYYEWKKENY